MPELSPPQHATLTPECYWNRECPLHRPASRKIGPGRERKARERWRRHARAAAAAGRLRDLPGFGGALRECQGPGAGREGAQEQQGERGVPHEARCSCKRCGSALMREVRLSRTHSRGLGIAAKSACVFDWAGSCEAVTSEGLPLLHAAVLTCSHGFGASCGSDLPAMALPPMALLCQLSPSMLTAKEPRNSAFPHFSANFTASGGSILAAGRLQPPIRSSHTLPPVLPWCAAAASPPWPWPSSPSSPGRRTSPRSATQRQ